MGNPYTRQSAADIVDGNVVEAAPINNEFNALQDAFNATTGHSHDGSLGEGPKISLTSSISGILPVANGGFGGIHKLNATTAPSATDDSSDGYVVGSVWIDTTNDAIYQCIDNTITAAVWVRIQPYDAALASIAGLTTATDKMIYTTAADTYAVTSLSSFARTLLDDVDASTALSTLGVSTFAKTLLDDADVSAAQSSLGITAFVKTILDDNDASAVRTTIGLGNMATQAQNSVTITGGSISGITDLAIADGGTGASTQADARTNLGLGTMATQNASAVAITGGTIGTAVTATTQSLGDSSTKIATTAFVQTAVSDGVGSITSIPAGAVLSFYRTTAPTGWLKANGAAVSRTTYADLWAAMGSPNTGDGSTTFTLPDLRGEFIRGLDEGRGIDTGRDLGTSQSEDTKSHTHTADPPSATTSSDSHNHTGTTSSNGNHNHTVNGLFRSGSGTSSTYISTENGQTASITTNTDGAHTHTFTTSTDAHTHTVDISSFTTGATGGTETRPRNIALLYCIKY